MNLLRTTYMGKNRTQPFALFLLSLCLSACTGRQTEETVADLPAVNAYDAAESACADLPIESFEVVPLETTDNSLIRNIGRVEMNDSLLFVQNDDEQLLAFDHKGRFRRSYGSRGSGPKEYTVLTTFYLDRAKGWVNVVDRDAHRIVSYAMDGRFMASRKLPAGTFNGVHTVCQLDSFHLLVDHYMLHTPGPIYSLVRLDTGERQVLDTVPMRTSRAAWYIGKHPMSYSQGQLKYIVPFEDKVYTLSAEGQPQPALTLTSDKPRVTREMKSEMDDFSLMTCVRLHSEGYFVGVSDVFETSRYLLLHTAGSGQSILLDKQTQESRLYANSLQEMGALPLLNIASAYRDYLIGTPPVFLLKEYCSRITEPTTDKRLARFKEAVDSLGFDDNGVVLLYKLKE